MWLPTVQQEDPPALLVCRKCCLAASIEFLIHRYELISMIVYLDICGRAEHVNRNVLLAKGTWSAFSFALAAAKKIMSVRVFPRKLISRGGKCFLILRELLIDMDVNL